MFRLVWLCNAVDGNHIHVVVVVGGGGGGGGGGYNDGGAVKEGEWLEHVAMVWGSGFRI
jgi:hypothetical protein